MEIFLYLGMFIASLLVVVKAADWFLDSAEQIGLKVGLSPFIVGVTIVGIGTSLPELVSSLAAISSGVTDIPIANAVGSNIANILLIIGVSAILAGELKPEKSLIDLDLPLVAASTALFVMTVIDGELTAPEAVLLVAGYAVYLLYTLMQKDDDHSVKKRDLEIDKKIEIKDFIMLFLGFVGLIAGSRFLIDSVISLSEILGMATGTITITAVAFGTSLPELLVASKAALRGKSSIVLGNILGSNIFNILMVVGIPGLLTTLTVDPLTLTTGLATLVTATVLFLVSGISQKIHRWEGIFYLFIYAVFIGKLFEIF